MASDLRALLHEAGRELPGPPAAVEDRALRVVLALRPPPRRRLRSPGRSQGILLLLVTALGLGGLGPVGEDGPSQLGRRAASLLDVASAAAPVQATVVTSGVAGDAATAPLPLGTPRRASLLRSGAPERRYARGGPDRAAADGRLLARRVPATPAP